MLERLVQNVRVHAAHDPEHPNAKSVPGAGSGYDDFLYRKYKRIR